MVRAPFALTCICRVIDLTKLAGARPLPYPRPMRRVAFLMLVFATAWILERSAAAQSAGLYLRGHGGYGGGSVGELQPGGAEPSLGPVLGGEVGVNLLLFNAYLNHDRFLSR